MADFEAPSFSLGLDSILFDSEPQSTPTTPQTDPSSSNQFPVAVTTFNNEDDVLETLVVDDSEPESLPKLKRLRRRLTVGAASPSVSAKAKAELNSTVVIDDEGKRTDPHLHTQQYVKRPVKRKQHLSNDQESVSTSCNNMVYTKLIESPLRRFQSTDSCSDSDDAYVNRKCNGSYSNSNLGKYDDELPQHVKRKQNVSNTLKDFPNAYRYFFHDDLRIQELVRSRLPNFSPLGNMLSIDLEQPSTSTIDYMGQFNFGESAKHAARSKKNKKSSSSRKIPKELETEELSQGWVNPKLGFDKVMTKQAVKRKVHTARQTAGHWLTVDGKKVYVGKCGQELTGRGAYMQYKKESGLGFKKVKRKSVTKKKK